MEFSRGVSAMCDWSLGRWLGGAQGDTSLARSSAVSRPSGGPVEEPRRADRQGSSLWTMRCWRSLGAPTMKASRPQHVREAKTRAELGAVHFLFEGCRNFV